MQAHSSRFIGPDGRNFLGVFGPNLWMNYLEDYLKEAEQNLEKLSTSTLEHYQKLCDQGDLGILTQKNHLENPSAFCENLLRGFFFAATYSFAEAGLVRWCERVKEISDDISLPFKNINASDQSLGKAMMYLKDVAGVKFPNLDQWKEWKELKEYQGLRNCVVHNQACLRPGDQQLKRYIESHQYLSIGIGKGLHGEDLIIFHKGFCEEAAKTIRDVLMMVEGYISHSLRKV
jgi:hypothetical protein